MAIGREQRMAELRHRLVAEFGEAVAPRAVGVLTLTEMAWHDCYGDLHPPEDVVDDMLVAAEGDLANLVWAAALAVRDARDLRLRADEVRGRAVDSA